MILLVGKFYYKKVVKPFSMAWQTVCGHVVVGVAIKIGVSYKFVHIPYVTVTSIHPIASSHHAHASIWRLRCCSWYKNIYYYVLIIVLFYNLYYKILIVYSPSGSTIIYVMYYNGKGSV